MLKYTDDEHNITLKIRKPIQTQYKIREHLYRHWMIELCSEFNLYNCEITLSFVKLKDNEDGHVENFGQNRYYITINRDLDEFMIVDTLVHEFIHIHQMFSGVLRMHSNGDIVWRGKKYRYSKNGEMKLNRNVISYKEFPWEIDVQHREEAIKEKIGSYRTILWFYINGR